MFGKQQKANENGTLYAITDGRTVPLSAVRDEVFSAKVLGDGIAFYSESGEICAPCDGRVTMLAKTLHAVGLESTDGTDILLHIGLDTAAEDGKGFSAFVRPGDRVRRGQTLLTFDNAALSEKYDTVIPMVLSEAESFSAFTPCGEQRVTVGEPVVRYRR